MHLLCQCIFVESSLRVGATESAALGESDRTYAKRARLGQGVEHTVIIMLNQGRSKMKILGYEDIKYAGPGSFSSFPSRLWHRSVRPTNKQAGALKVAFFMTFE